MKTIFSLDNFNISIDNLLTKKDSSGIDGILISQYKDYFEINNDKIIDSLIDGTYKPNIVEEVLIPKDNGKDRTISKYTCTDRVILDIIKRYLTPRFEDSFSNYSYAYRENKGTLEAVKQAAKYIEDDNDWVVELDIKDFFDSINLQRLESILSKEVKNLDLLKLIHKYLYIYVKNMESKKKKTTGIIQGSPISPLLSNIYMRDFDRYLESKYNFCRFSDNINIYCKTYIEAQNVFLNVQNYLNTKLGLSLNLAKSGIYESVSRKFLGYVFYEKEGQIFIKQYKKEPFKFHKNWYTSSITKIDKNYHIVNDGILTKKDFSILFENDEKKFYIPVETCGAINVFSNATFTSSFFEFMNTKKLDINIYNRYGKYLGSFNSSTHYNKNKTLLKQLNLYVDNKKRLELAKKIEIASIYNQRENIRYYYKHNKINVLLDSINYITDCIDKMKKCKTIDELLLIEARSKQKYYQTFDAMISDENFMFEKRTKRPPQNPLNALISFGNTILYQRIATEIHKTSLDIRIGIVHSTNNRLETLNLDISEIFKPVIIDKTIFSMIHNNEIKADEHFEKHDKNGVYLNKEGKIIFLEAIERKLYQKLSSVTYETIIRREIRHLEKHITEDGKYKPFKYT